MEPWSNSTRNAVGVRLDADRYGLDTQNALARDQWNTYLAMFMPVEDTAIQWASDPRIAQQNANRAIGYVDQAFDANAAAGERRRRAYGINLNAEEQTAVDRRNNLQESLAKVQAANSTRDQTQVLQRSVIGGGTAGGIV